MNHDHRSHTCAPDSVWDLQLSVQLLYTDEAQYSKKTDFKLVSLSLRLNFGLHQHRGILGNCGNNVQHGRAEKWWQKADCFNAGTLLCILRFLFLLRFFIVRLNLGSAKSSTCQNACSLGQQRIKQVQELFDAALGFSSKLKQHVGQSNKKTL